MRAAQSAAETEILGGAPDTPALLSLIDAAASAIAQLEPAHDILVYSRTHGAGPYSAVDLEKAVPYEREIIEQTMDELATEGILKPRKATE